MLNKNCPGNESLTIALRKRRKENETLFWEGWKQLFES